jgi:transposase
MRVPVPFPHLHDCRLERVLAADDAVHLALRPTGRAARCPRCRRRSRRVHSTYTRRVADLPLAGRPVVLHLRVRRFRCPARRCPQRTFAEQVPQIVARYGRRTHALRRALEQVGLCVGGRPGARLGGRLGLTATRDTLLRAVRALPEPAPPAARVLGVDEFALRRGRRYGTVLVDVERHRPLDLLDGRSAAQFAAWLEDRPPPEVVCRDRAECFAEGARQGAPRAVQVADRYHLLANLGDAVERVAARHAHRWHDDPLAVPPAPAPEAVPPPAGPPPPSGGGIRERHRERYRQVQALAARGLTITAMGRRLRLDRKTVRKFARAPSAEAIGPPRRADTASALLAPFASYLVRRWQEGCQDGARLGEELRGQGYRGSARTLRRYLTGLRRGLPSHPPAPPVSARTVAGLLLRPPEQLSAADAGLLERLCTRCAELATTRRLAQTFAALVRERQGALALRRWLDAAARCGIPALVAFAAGLRRDEAAVAAGVTLPWSSGVVEGTNTRIKLVKRMMYGRGAFDLLRRRVLLAT